MQRCVTRRGLLAAIPAAAAFGQTQSPRTTAAVVQGFPELRFDERRDFAAWQKALRDRLARLLALPDRLPPLLAPSIQGDSETGSYTMQRIEFVSEPGETVPGYLLRPRHPVRRPLPVMICLQGHSPGMHISIGRAQNEKDEEAIRGGRDFASQAIRNGWAALVIEQRGFGRRAEPGVACMDLSLRALLRGRPITGQRVLDVIRAVDFLATQRDLDMKRIGCMGNSTGGTVSFYAGCVERRISLSVVSCSFCTFADSWLSRKHCACGYVPGLLKLADMPDLAGLIAPNHLYIAAGREDPLAGIEGVKRGYQIARRAFATAGVPGRVKLLIGEGGHQFYPDLVWPAVREFLNQKA